MVDEIYQVAFPHPEMMAHREKVPFCVLEVGEEYLQIRLLESCPTIKGFEEEGLPQADQEFRIVNKTRKGDSLIDLLRDGAVAPFYTSEVGEDYFAGTFFGKGR